MTTPRRTKTVAILGGSYGGISAARALAQSLPSGWKIVMIDRNSHANHLYVFPRFAIVPGHEHKAFVPLGGVFGAQPHPHRFIHGTITEISSHSLTLTHALPDEKKGVSDEDQEEVSGPSCIPFDYAIYALGSKLPAPIDVWSTPEDLSNDGKLNVHENAIVPPAKTGTKAEGIAWMQASQQRIARAPSVLVVGGGALGIQCATDIKWKHPRTDVTLLHSRAQLLPRFDPLLGRKALAALVDMGINVHLSSRLDLASLKAPAKPNGNRTARTTDGKELAASLVLLCTGQSPNTELMRRLVPESIVAEGDSRGMVSVKRTMQVAIPVPASKLETTLENQTSNVDAVAEDLAKTQITSETPVSSEADSQAEASSEEVASTGTDELEDDTHLSVVYPHWFCVGDAADAFNAINAGHTAYYQALVAVHNIGALITAEEAAEELERLNDEPCTSDAAAARIAELEKACKPTLSRYAPGAPAIKVSLGVGAAAWDYGGKVDHQMSGLDEDLMVSVIWDAWGQPGVTEEGMYA